MLYSFSYQDALPELPELPGLRIVQCEDPLVMSVIGQITYQAARDRLLNDNRAYVAYLNDVAAAFGYVALGKARIGELNHEFIVPMNHSYLWNFRTLPDFQGLGIYPRLLQAICTGEQPAVERFWILHAPENEASRRGIRKAGFRFIADVSLQDTERVICQTAEKDADDFAELFGFTPAGDTPAASCWMCTSPWVRKKSRMCCCAAKHRECSGSLTT